MYLEENLQSQDIQYLVHFEMEGLFLLRHTKDNMTESTLSLIYPLSLIMRCH